MTMQIIDQRGIVGPRLAAAQIPARTICFTTFL
jgi:hypothetical protein